MNKIYEKPALYLYEYKIRDSFTSSDIGGTEEVIPDLLEDTGQ